EFQEKFINNKSPLLPQQITRGTGQKQRLTSEKIWTKLMSGYNKELGEKGALHGQAHDRIDDVIVGSSKGSDSLITGGTGLINHEFNVLLLDTSGILLSAIFILGDGGETRSGSIIGNLDSVDGVQVSVLAQILNLGLSEDDVGVRSRRLVHVGVVDDEEDVLQLQDANTADSMDGLESELGEQLAGLLLGARLLAGMDNLLGETSSLGHLKLTLADLSLFEAGDLLVVTAIRAVVRSDLLLELLLLLLSSSLLSLSLGLSNHD
ncbi:hypothetical protein PENTCL1PPCAC_22624, partial [Pristionchus entomophagus]